MYCIVYLSVATRPFEEAELRELLVRWRMHNHRRDISGVLLYGDDGNIMQVLEGEQTTVESVFAQIEQDCRHRNVVKVADGPVATRVFADWSMGFRPVSGAEFAQLSGYLDLNAPNFLAPHAASHRKPPVMLRALLQDFVAAMPAPSSWEPVPEPRKAPTVGRPLGPFPLGGTRLSSHMA